MIDIDNIKDLSIERVIITLIKMKPYQIYSNISLFHDFVIIE